MSDIRQIPYLSIVPAISPFGLKSKPDMVLATFKEK